MNINSISAISKTPEFIRVEKTGGKNDSEFGNILQGLIDNVNQTDAAVQEDILKIAAGEADDLHTITIHAEKAQLALELLTQVRNKAIDAYNEIMKINI